MKTGGEQRERGEEPGTVGPGPKVSKESTQDEPVMMVTNDTEVEEEVGEEEGPEDQVWALKR